MIEVSSGGDQFPELRTLAGHIGVPWLGEMLSLVMNDTSAYKVIRYPKDLVEGALRFESSILARQRMPCRFRQIGAQ
jgi:hypothetical protein